MPLIIPFNNLRLSPLTHSNSELAEIQIVSLKNKMHSRGKTRDGRGGKRTDMRTVHDWRTKISLRQHQFAMQLCFVSFRYQLTVKYLLKLVTADQLSMISATDHKRLGMTKT